MPCFPKDVEIFKDFERRWRWIIPEFICVSPSPSVEPSPSYGPSPSPSPSPSTSPPPPWQSDRYELCPDPSASPSPSIIASLSPSPIPSGSPLPSFIHNSDRYILCASPAPSVSPVVSGSPFPSQSPFASPSPSPSPSTQASPSVLGSASPSPVYASPSPCVLNLDVDGWYCVTKLVYDNVTCEGDPSIIFNGICVLGQTVIDEYSDVQPCDCFEKESLGQGVRWIIFSGPFVGPVACSFYCGSLSSISPSPGHNSDEYEPCIGSPSPIVSPIPSPLASPSPILPSPEPVPLSCPSPTYDLQLKNFTPGDLTGCPACLDDTNAPWDGFWNQNTPGTCNWIIDYGGTYGSVGGKLLGTTSQITLVAGSKWTMKVTCLNGGEVTVWEGEKTFGATPAGVYTRTGGCDTDPTLEVEIAP